MQKHLLSTPNFKKSGGGNLTNHAPVALKDGYILDYATNKPVDIRKPEEKVRQDYIRMLHENYHYLKNQLDIEVPIKRGSIKKQNEKADIVIYKTSNINHRDQFKDILCIVETKKPHKKDGVAQLMSYMSATSSEFGVWTNGEEIEYIYKDFKTGELKQNYIYQIPKHGQKIADLERITRNKLEPAKNLKTIFRRIHRTLYSNTNISRKEKLGNELIRLIFCKIYDELYYTKEVPDFRIGINEKPQVVKDRIVKIWNKVKKELISDGIFEDHETIVIDPKSIVYVVGELENYSLTKTDKDVVGAAFEIFAEKQFVGEKGEFFTPRPIVKMCIDILDPKPDETIIDPACGSGGFLIYALEHVWSKMDNDPKYTGNVDNLKMFKKKIAEKCFYGIDKEIDLVKICKAYMQIIGDGKSNIVCADSLKCPDEWDNNTAKAAMTNADGTLKQFDIVITNPPFGSKIKIKHKHILSQYDLGHKWKDNSKTNSTNETDPQILFIELCLNLLKNGGRMAIVLPDGIFGNPTDEYIRDYIKQRAEILAIIDCHHTSFMPHTHTKTSVLIVKKYNGISLSNYPIFMSIVEKCGHDNRGNDITIQIDGQEILDEEFSKVTRIFKDNPSRVLPEYNRLGFTLYENKLKNNILVPRYYNPETQLEINKLKESGLYKLCTIKELIENKTISVKGAGSTANSKEYTIYDNIPFLRTSDLGVFETRSFAVQNVNKEIYLKHKDKQKLQEGDILFVKDGTYRIGEMILLTKHDLNMLVQSHFLILRVLKPTEISPYLLFYLMNSNIVKKQINEKTFIQATLSTIGNRLLEVVLPIPIDNKKITNITNNIKTIIDQRRELREQLKTALL